jgi:hypothetical protein
MTETEVKTEVKQVLGRGFIEETFWLIGHLINIEEHLFESGMIDQAVLVRNQRRQYVSEWAKLLNLDEKLLNRDWCIYKHLLNLLIHVEEVATSGEALMNIDFAIKTKELYDYLKEYAFQLIEFHRRGGVSVE